MASGMRLIVSCVSSFLILSLLLFMVHRLRQRRRERIESLIGANRECPALPPTQWLGGGPRAGRRKTGLPGSCALPAPAPTPRLSHTSVVGGPPALASQGVWAPAGAACPLKTLDTRGWWQLREHGPPSSAHVLCHSLCLRRVSEIPPCLSEQARRLPSPCGEGG